MDGKADHAAWRRAAGVGLTCLSLGAATSVLTAWAAALYGPRPRGPGCILLPRGYAPPSPPVALFCCGWSATGAIMQTVTATALAPSPLPPGAAAAAGLPAWAALPSSFPRGALFQCERYGWPFMCMTCTRVHNEGPRLPFGRVVGGVTVRFCGFTSPECADMAPLRPVWGALALSTAAHGAGILAVFTGVIAIRRGPAARRVARGLCPRCGYDLLGDLAAGCPECGWTRESAAVPRRP